MCKCVVRLGVIPEMQPWILQDIKAEHPCTHRLSQWLNVSWLIRWHLKTVLCLLLQYPCWWRQLSVVCTYWLYCSKSLNAKHSLPLSHEHVHLKRHPLLSLVCRICFQGHQPRWTHISSSQGEGLCSCCNTEKSTGELTSEACATKQDLGLER